MTRQVLAAAMVALAATTGSMAQGIDAPESVEAIVGSQVDEKEASAAADPARVIEAMGKARESAAAVRKVTEVTGVEIVFLADAAATEGGPPAEIQDEVAERKDDIEALRQEIEGNALLYHAINSRQVLMRDILALEIDEDKHVTVYAAAKPAG